MVYVSWDVMLLTALDLMRGTTTVVMTLDYHKAFIHVQGLL